MHVVAIALVCSLLVGCTSSTDAASTEAQGGASGTAGAAGSSGASGSGGSGGAGGGQAACTPPSDFVCSAPGGAKAQEITEAYRWDTTSKCLRPSPLPSGTACDLHCPNDLDLAAHHQCLRASDGALLIVELVGHDRLLAPSLPGAQSDEDCVAVLQTILAVDGGSEGTALPLCHDGASAGAGGAGS